MDRKFKGIVIGSKDHKENDRLLTIFSLEFGKINARLVGVKKPKAKLKVFKELFCFADFVATENNGFLTVTSAELIDSFSDLTLDIDRFYEASAVIDALDKVTASNEQNVPLFLETLGALKAICYEKTAKKYAFCKFLIDVFEGAGYKLSVDKCHSCNEGFISGKYLNLDSGEITCKNCRSRDSALLSDKAFVALRLLGNTSFEKLGSLKLALCSEEELFEVLKKNFKRRFLKELNVLM